jgi:hypothetical protein
MLRNIRHVVKIDNCTFERTKIMVKGGIMTCLPFALCPSPFAIFI